MKVSGTLLNEAVQNTADVSAYWQYSGRFMYGKHCFGVVGDAGAATRFVLAVVDLARDVEEAEELARYLRTERFSHDSLGRQAIFYWEGVEAVTETGESYFGEDDESDEEGAW